MEFRAHQLPPAPEYSAGLEWSVKLLLRTMDPVARLQLARRMLLVFQTIEAEASEQLSANDNGGQ